MSSDDRTFGFVDRATYISEAGNAWLLVEVEGRLKWVRPADGASMPDTDSVAALESFDAAWPIEVATPSEVVASPMSAWDEFRAEGKLWWLNRILHTFDWSIVVEIDDTGKAVRAWPARTDCLGFPDEVNERRLADFRAGLER